MTLATEDRDGRVQLWGPRGQSAACQSGSSKWPSGLERMTTGDVDPNPAHAARIKAGQLLAAQALASSRSHHRPALLAADHTARGAEEQA